MLYPKTKSLRKKGYLFSDKLTERVFRVMPSLADDLLEMHDNLTQSFPNHQFSLQWDPAESRVVLYVRTWEYGPNFMDQLVAFRKAYKDKLKRIFVTTDFAYPEEKNE